MFRSRPLNSISGDFGQVLQRFNPYLRLQLSANLTGKVDLSGVVQQTLLEACQSI